MALTGERIAAAVDNGDGGVARARHAPLGIHGPGGVNITLSNMLTNTGHTATSP